MQILQEITEINEYYYNPKIISEILTYTNKQTQLTDFYREVAEHGVTLRDIFTGLIRYTADKTHAPLTAEFKHTIATVTKSFENLKPFQFHRLTPEDSSKIYEGLKTVREATGEGFTGLGLKASDGYEIAAEDHVKYALNTKQDSPFIQFNQQVAKYENILTDNFLYLSRAIIFKIYNDKIIKEKLEQAYTERNTMTSKVKAAFYYIFKRQIKARERNRLSKQVKREEQQKLKQSKVLHSKAEEMQRNLKTNTQAGQRQHTKIKEKAVEVGTQTLKQLQELTLTCDAITTYTTTHIMQYDNYNGANKMLNAYLNMHEISTKSCKFLQQFITATEDDKKIEEQDDALWYTSTELHDALWQCALSAQEFLAVDTNVNPEFKEILQVMIQRAVYEHIVEKPKMDIGQVIDAYY